MNFLDGQIERDNGRLWFTAGSGIRLPLASSTAEAAQSHLDRKVVAGIRPEALRVDTEGRSPEAASIQLKVLINEPLGDRIDVSGRTDDGHDLIARVSTERDLSPGVEVQVHVDPSCVHLFEPGEYGRHIVFDQ